MVKLMRIVAETWEGVKEEHKELPKNTLYDIDIGGLDGVKSYKGRIYLKFKEGWVLIDAISDELADKGVASRELR